MALQKEEKDKLIKDFGINTQDTGSIAIQVALLTERIRQLTEHLKENRKDFSSKRGLLKMVSQRRAFLQYLQQTNADAYQSLIQRLQLKK